MTLLGGVELVLICLVRIGELLVPVLIELLVLLDVRLLALLLLGLVHEDQLLLLAGKLLVFELVDAVVGHLGLDVSALLLHLQAVLVQCLSTRTRSVSIEIEDVPRGGLSLGC